MVIVLVRRCQEDNKDRGETISRRGLSYYRIGEVVGRGCDG